jgi:hypothetical protein
VLSAVEMRRKFARLQRSAEYENPRLPALHAIAARWENCSHTNLGGAAWSVQKISQEDNLEFPKKARQQNRFRAGGHGLHPDQVMLISAAVSVGIKQVVCVPAGVSVPGTVGKKVPSGFTVAPWIVTPEVAARLPPVIN